MAKKQRKIVMNGNNWGTYELRFVTYLKLLLIRLYLWALRWFRRIKRGLGYCKYALIIIPFWAGYAIVVYFWGVQRGELYTLPEIIWDMKTSVFSSVILASITAFITQYEKNEFSYLEQHRIYINIMGDCSALYKDFLNLLCRDDSKNSIPFWPFYTGELRKTVHKQFSQFRRIDKSSAEFRHVVSSIAELRRSLEELERSHFNGILAECNKVKANNLITSSLNGLSYLERQLDSDEEYPYWNNLLSSVSHTFYELIELLRLPWRRDLKLKVTSLKLIYREDTSIANTFYNSAFLNVIDYASYENMRTYIDKLRKAANQSRKVNSQGKNES